MIMTTEEQGGSCMQDNLHHPIVDFILKAFLAIVVITGANAVFTLYDYYWEIVVTGIAVAIIGVALDWLVLPRMGSFPTLYVDKMAFLIVISLLSLGLSQFTIVPFYVAEGIAILLAVFEGWLHRLVMPGGFRLER